MIALRNIFCALGVLVVIAGIVELLLLYRAAQMRSLAYRRGWTYSACNVNIWQLIFKQKKYPSDFWIGNSPMTAMWGAISIVEGKCGDARVVILDSLLHFGPKADRYTTFIGVKTHANPFPLQNDKEKVIHSKDWFALYRTRISLLTWSLSVKRIEQHLDLIGS